MNKNLTKSTIPSMLVLLSITGLGACSSRATHELADQRAVPSVASTSTVPSTDASTPPATFDPVTPTPETPTPDTSEPSAPEPLDPVPTDVIPVDPEPGGPLIEITDVLAELPRCSLLRVPPDGAVMAGSSEADFDGDGVTDRSFAWMETAGDGTTSWYVGVDLAHGPASAVELLGVGFSYASVVGAYDLDFSLGETTNRSEFVAVVGSAAGVVYLTMFGVDDAGCAFQFDDGTVGPFTVTVGSALGTLTGLRCDGGAGSQFLVMLTALTDDKVTYSTEDVRIERSGPTSLEKGAVLLGELPVGSDALTAYHSASCGSEMWVGG